MTHVLDASSLLAFLHDEPGSDTVARALDSAQVSAVNWAEVLQKSLWRQVDIKGMLDEFIDLGVRIEPFTPAQAEIAARLWERTKRQGLSFADRACLALALECQVPVLTSDQAWKALEIGLEIHLIR